MDFQTVFVANRLNEVIALGLEPWGREIRMPPGFRVEAVLTGPPGNVEVEHEDHRIILYGWEGSTVVVLHGGEEI